MKIGDNNWHIKSGESEYKIDYKGRVFVNGEFLMKAIEIKEFEDTRYSPYSQFEGAITKIILVAEGDYGDIELTDIKSITFSKPERRFRIAVAKPMRGFDILFTTDVSKEAVEYRVIKAFKENNGLFTHDAGENCLRITSLPQSFDYIDIEEVDEE